MKPLFKLKNKFLKEKFSFGLDIGSYTAKLVILESGEDKTELCDFYLEPTQPELAAALKGIVQYLAKKNIYSINKCKMNISLSGSSIIIRYVSFPKMNSDELRQSLKFEAQKYIPFSIEEVNLDSYILRENLPDNKMLVMLAAAKKELINKRLEVIKGAGMKINIIDIDSLALINAFNFNYFQDNSLKTKTIALLNIGAVLSNINILENGMPGLSRDIQIGSNNFTQKIQDLLGIDYKSAEEIKLKPCEEKLAKVSSAVESVLSNLAREIRVSFDYYESQSTSSVAKIFLSGGGSRFLGLKDMLANLLGIEVEYWDPLAKINISADIDSQKTKSISGQLAVAVGLALRK